MTATDGRKPHNPYAPIDVFDPSDPGWPRRYAAQATNAFWCALWQLPLTASQLRLVLWLVAQTYGTGLLTATGRAGKKGQSFEPRAAVSFWRSQPAKDIGLDENTVGDALKVLESAHIVRYIERGHGAIRGGPAVETFVELEVEPTHWDTAVFAESTARAQRSRAGRAGGRATALKRAQQTLGDGDGGAGTTR